MSLFAGVMAMQLYSARMFSPIDEQLSIIAEAGFSHVETFGSFHDRPEESRRQFAAHGLKVASAHIPFEVLADDTNRAVDIALGLGARNAIAPYLSSRAQPQDSGGWRRIGERLERAAAICATQGLIVGWHNHDFEFQPLPDGSMPIEHLLGSSLMWEPDLAWIVRAGADPAAWLARYRGRLAAVHVKDIAPAGDNEDEDGWADVGAGVMPWADLWKRSVQSGARLFIAEHDNPKSFARFARASAAAMRRFAGEAK